MSSWQLARIRAQLLVLACLLGGVGLLDLAIGARAGWDAFGCGEQSQTFSRLELASAKALALAQAARRGTRVGLVVGMSTADWGVDLRQLEATQPGTRWAKVTGEFSSFTNLLDIAHRFEHAEVAPARTVLCVHYAMLLGARRYKGTRAERVSQIAERFHKSRSSSEIARLVTLSWLGNNRAPAANAIELQLGGLRERILGAFSQPAELMYPPLPNPFEDSVNSHAPMHPSVRQRHVEGLAAAWQRAQAPGSSEDELSQAQALTEIVEIFGRQPGLVVVLMPEHSALRGIEPEAFARAMLARALAAARVAQPVLVIDLRAALPDPYFADEVHSLPAGRPILTGALSRALAQQAPAP